MRDSRPPRPPASFSLPAAQIDQLDAMAAAAGAPRSRVLEGLISSALADGDASQPAQPAPTAPGSAKSAFLRGFEAAWGLACPSGQCPPLVLEGDNDLAGNDEAVEAAEQRLADDLDDSDD